MYICYVDESGHCGEKYNPEQPVEVLFGVMLDLTKLTKAHRQHNEIIKIFKDAVIYLKIPRSLENTGLRSKFPP